MRFSLIIFCLLSTLRIFGFSQLLPYLTSFTPKDYQAGKQNWGITQDRNGFMFIANNSGVLRYDGSEWKKIQIKNSDKKIRSIFADQATDRIYVGLFEEFGYLSQLADGQYEYTSLSDSLKEFHMQNDEVWNIIKLENKIYFQTFASYFVFDGNECLPYVDNGCFLFFMKTNQKIFGYIIDNGVYRLDTRSNKFVSTTIPADLGRIIQIKQKGEINYIITENKGIYIQTANDIRRIDNLGSEYPIANRALFAKDEKTIYIGSVNKGVYCFNIYGELNWIMDKSNGLADNNILNLYEDISNNIWLALNNGISLLHNNSAISYYNSQENYIGRVYGASLYNDKLYLSTGDGVFCSEKGEYNKLEKINKITNPTWQINQYDKQLFLGGNELTYTIKNNEVYSLGSLGGGRCLTKAYINEKDVLLQGTYTKLGCYEKDENDKWGAFNVIEGFMQPIINIEVDYQGNVWAAHHYKGLYRLRIDSDFRNVISQEYFETLDSTHNAPISISKMDNRVVFCDGKQLYIYDDIEKRIIPYISLNNQLNNFKKAKRIIPAGNDKYWFILDKAMALIKISGDKISFIDIVDQTSFMHLMVDEGDYIIPLGNEKHLICLEEGYMIYDEQKKSNQKANARLKISQVAVRYQSDIEFVSIKEKPVLPHNKNQLAIRVSYPEWENTNLQLAYRLNDSEGWFYQDKNQPIVLQALTAGDYDIEIQIVDFKNSVIDKVTYKFEIRPPFYKTNIAKTLYVLFILLVIFIVRRMMVKRFERQKDAELTALKIKQLQENRLQEERIMRLENEKLQSELAFKSKELANYALQELNQKEILKKIKVEVIENSSSSSSNRSVNNLVKKIDKYIGDDKSWAIFEQNFDLIHQQFFRTLRHNFPVLTSNDLRLCAYLRLNLSTKEIADLLNITVKGVEVARYRLRKKLNLSPDVELLKFLLENTNQ